jgi:HSP20 family protein
LSDPWWKRRKKKDPRFNDLYDELERLGDLIDETMQKAFDNTSKDTPTKRNRSNDFSVKIGSDGKPRIREFDNRQLRQAEFEVSDEPEPLVDVIEEGETVIVLVVLQGVDKDDIDLRLTGDTLTFSVDAVDFEWYDELKLPARVNPKSARASYKNGVLEIKVKKVETPFRADRVSLKK